ncbi:AAA family ATPase [Aliiroseovarius subalbicans]|uniref:AAA family ATPase n=1 Tax=Aliiroseovarius subalbicans TaxID=2925840 RepID=UPI001F563133|nr:AAA family ATPase [Aliiroseovarius subalbicans]MCI2397963.1 AAA family ATPase [Aliiroseovarius subalbicans]
MSSSVALQPDPAPIVACTISRDVQNFDLLIEDMEAELGETWGDLSLSDAKAFFTQPDAEALEFVAIAMDDEDEANLAQVADVIKTAVAQNIKVIVIAEEVSPIALHQLLKMGAEEFVPYPLPEGALHDAIERLRAPEPAPQAPVPDEMATTLKATGDREGVVLPIHGLAGGTGATTLAVNLAWELANIEKDNPPRVCLLDLDLQYGTVSTYLDLPRRETVYEMLSDTESMDQDSFMQALLTFNDRLQVLTAPNEMLPLDLVTSEDIQRVIDFARANFDYVVIDMPSTVVQWTETVLTSAHVYFTTMELDMRSAQNTLRMIRALKAEELPVSKLRYVLNRAPKFTDLSGKARVKRLAESLDITIELQLPDGAKPVVQAGDHGIPLADAATKNPLRKEIQKLAASVHEVNKSAAVAAQ